MIMRLHCLVTKYYFLYPSNNVKEYDLQVRGGLTIGGLTIGGLTIGGLTIGGLST